MYKELLNTAILAARKSASVILQAQGRAQLPQYKGRTNLVTETDLRSEEIILNYLQKAYPDHAILAEESGKKEQNSDYLWVIDPLDGTTNFVHGYPGYAVSIGCLVKGVPTLGVVVELPINRIYTAVRGGGAFRDEKPIKVSTNSRLDRSLLVTGFGYEHGTHWDTNMDLFKYFTDKTQGVRRLGAAVIDLCYVACGIFEGFWELDLQPWDTAAGIVIVEEAGGKVTCMDGKSYSIFNNQILATNSFVHTEIVQSMKQKINSIKPQD